MMKRIISMTPDIKGTGWIVTLECGHTRHYHERVKGTMSMCDYCKTPTEGSK